MSKSANEKQILKAWHAGFAAGRAGNETASPPYLLSSVTGPLIREWTRGHEAGLVEWRHHPQQTARAIVLQNE